MSPTPISAWSVPDPPRLTAYTGVGAEIGVPHNNLSTTSRRPRRNRARRRDHGPPDRRRHGPSTTFRRHRPVGDTVHISDTLRVGATVCVRARCGSGHRPIGATVRVGDTVSVRTRHASGHRPIGGTVRVGDTVLVRTQHGSGHSTDSATRPGRRHGRHAGLCLAHRPVCALGGSGRLVHTCRGRQPSRRCTNKRSDDTGLDLGRNYRPVPSPVYRENPRPDPAEPVPSELPCRQYLPRRQDHPVGLVELRRPGVRPGSGSAGRTA